MFFASVIIARIGMDNCIRNSNSVSIGNSSSNSSSSGNNKSKQ